MSSDTLGPTPLRIGIVSSWPAHPASGSGTATAIRGLARGLEELGHEVARIVPRDGGSRELTPRLAFNLGLPVRRHRLLRELDLVVGVDMDGVCLRPTSPYVVCLKGVAADEALHESGSAGLGLRAAARLEARNARRADVVVVPSAYSADEAARRYRLDPGRIAVVPEAVSLPGEGEEATGRDPEPTVLCVGRQYPRKHTELLLRALAHLRVPVPDVRVRVVGDGPELPRLRELTRRLGVEDRVTFLGAVGAARLRAEYDRAWCFCLPSEQEAFGIAFVEAMAAGLPVVAVRAAAVPEVVEEGRTGFLVPPGEPVALARALEQVLTSADLRHAIGEAGREVARSRTPRAHAAGVLRAVEERLSRGGGPPPGSVPAPEGDEEREDRGNRPDRRDREASAARRRRASRRRRPAADPGDRTDV